MLALGVLDYQAQRLSILVIEWVGECVTVFVPAKPGEEDGGDIVPPGISTGEPELTMTTVRGFTAATSSSCRPGSASDSRSYPSDSTFALVPTTTTAESAWRGKPELAAGSGREEDLHGLDPFAHCRCARRSAVGDP